MNEQARKLQALITLGIARQAPPDELAQRVYLDGLLVVPAAIVERACRALARSPRDDFEPAFPSLGSLIERCRQVREHDSMANAPKRLREARPEPLTRDEAKAWVNRLKAAVQSRRFEASR